MTINLSNKQQKLLDKRHRARGGYVYIMHLYDDVYKIGFSTFPFSRLAKVKTNALLCDIEIQPSIISMLPVRDMAWAERTLHKKYSEYHLWTPFIKREAFILSKEQIVEIEKSKAEIRVPLWWDESTEIYIDWMKAVKEHDDARRS